MQSLKTFEKAKSGTRWRDLQIIFQIEQKCKQDARVAQIAREPTSPWIMRLKNGPKIVQAKRDCRYRKNNDGGQPLVSECRYRIKRADKIGKHVCLFHAPFDDGATIFAPELRGDSVSCPQQKALIGTGRRTVVGRAELVDVLPGAFGKRPRSLGIHRQ